MGRFQGARQIGVRRDRADQWRDRNVRPPGRPDRETPGRREGHRDRPQCLSSAIVEGDRRRRDRFSWAKYGCTRCRHQGSFLGRHRRGARLSVGQKRRADSDCRNQGRQGRRSNSFRPGRQRQRRRDHLAGRRHFVRYRSSSWAAVSAASRSIALSERSRNCCRPPPMVDFEIATRTVPLSDVEQAWPGDACNPRIVFTVGGVAR